MSVLRRRAPLAGLLALLAATVAFTPADAASVQDPASSTGSEFWVAFSDSVGKVDSFRTLLLAGDEATTGTVSVASLGIEKAFSLTPGEVTAVTLPASVTVPQQGRSQLGVQVRADAPVTLAGMNERLGTADGFLALPSEALGTEYVVAAYDAAVFQGTTHPSTLVVVGTAPGTTVDVTAADGATSRVTLGAGATWSLSGADVTGTVVQADAPVAVFSGAVCAYVPVGEEACDHLVEQQVPVDRLGTVHVTEPFAGRTGGDTVRVLAVADGTTVSVDGAQVATLDRGAFHEQLVDGPAVVESSAPVVVTQYANGATFDGTLWDPAMATVPAVDHHLTRHVVATPLKRFPNQFLNVVVPAGAEGTVVLDGDPVDASAFRGDPGSGWLGARLPVGPGHHVVEADEPIGVVAYGWDFYDSYAFPAGLGFPVGCGATGPVSGPLADAGAAVGSIAGDEVGEPLAAAACGAASLEDGELPLP